MKRREFEALVKDQLDNVLLPRGFALVPQPPGDVTDDEPAALYEADPADFAQHYPTLTGTMDLDNVSCVDLWVKLDPTSGSLSFELEGTRFDPLGHGSLEQQLQSFAASISAVLDTDHLEA